MFFLFLGLPIVSIYLIIKGKGSYLRIIGIIVAIVYVLFIAYMIAWAYFGQFPITDDGF